MRCSSRVSSDEQAGLMCRIRARFPGSTSQNPRFTARTLPTHEPYLQGGKMDDTISSHPIDDFDAAWQIVGQQYQPAIQVTSALIKLTGAGERLVEVERLAAAS